MGHDLGTAQHKNEINHFTNTKPHVHALPVSTFRYVDSYGALRLEVVEGPKCKHQHFVFLQNENIKTQGTRAPTASGDTPLC